MKIQTITVEIHEKRNHPHEYGHYDSRVSYTAQLDEGEEAAQVVESLQFQARQQVAIECDRWIADIERKHQIEKTRDDLRWTIQNARNNGFSAEKMTLFQQKLEHLPVEERTTFWHDLNSAIGEYHNGIADTLTDAIRRAARHTLSTGQRERFYELLQEMPEPIQADYRARMEAALAGEVPKAPLTENKEDIAF